MKKVLVLGGGFAGVAALLELTKRTKKVELTLVDKQKFHLFNPSLYEVATSEEPQQNIAIPFKEIFPSKVKHVQGVVSKIDPEGKISLENRDVLEFDFLIIALGSESAYFGIKGLSVNSLDLKTLLEAVKIKNKIKEVFKENSSGGKVTKIAIGGGGFSGTELAAELITYRERLVKAMQKQKSLIEISVIEGSNRLLNGLDQHISGLAQKRLEKAGVKVYLNTFIQEVFPDKLTTKEGNQVNFDIFIWTGGVTASHVLRNSGFEINKRGQIDVDNFLRVKGKEKIFAVGDSAAYLDPKTHQTAPGVAQVAEEEGRIAGENIARLLEGVSLKPYHLRHFGYLVPLKGKFVAAEMGFLRFEGILAWFLQQIIFLRYLLGILSLEKAFQRWNEFELDLEQD